VEQKDPTIFTPSMWRKFPPDPYMQSTRAAVPRRSGAVISVFQSAALNGVSVLGPSESYSAQQLNNDTLASLLFMTKWCI
jgi:hypothetical protein